MALSAASLAAWRIFSSSGWSAGDEIGLPVQKLAATG
jgi:hypothetical protein